MGEGFRERQARVKAQQNEKRAGKLDAKRQKLVDTASEALHDGEVIEDICTGMMNTSRFGGVQTRRGSLVVTNTRLFFYSKKIGGHEVHEFAYHMVLSLQTKTGVAFGSIHLHAAGDQVEIQQVDKGEVERVSQSIRAHMNVTGGAAGAPAASSTSLADELGKLAGLRDAGVLSDEEFDAQKARLLAST